jgi:hypothetical protein
MLQGWSVLCPKEKNVEFKIKLEKLKRLELLEIIAI